MYTIKEISCPSPIGNLRFFLYEGALISVLLEGKMSLDIKPYLDRYFSPYTIQKEAYHPYCKEWEAYFKGELKRFSIPILLKTTPFQKKVLMAVCEIPYGETVAYKDIGVMIGSNAYRAIGNALKHNPIPIRIPCHRVIGTNNIGGFSLGKGLATKMQLLKLEKSHR